MGARLSVLRPIRRSGVAMDIRDAFFIDALRRLETPIADAVGAP